MQADKGVKCPFCRTFIEQYVVLNKWVKHCKPRPHSHAQTHTHTETQRITHTSHQTPAHSSRR